METQIILIQRLKSELVFRLEIESPPSPSSHKRRQSREQPKFIPTCNIDPIGIVLLTSDPIPQKKVYKPDEVKFSFDSTGSQSSSMKIKLTLGTGSETKRLRIDYADKSLANEITRILNLPIPFPTSCKQFVSPSYTYVPPLSSIQYDISDDDAWLVGHLRFYFNTQTIEISVGHQSGWNVSVDFKRTVGLHDIADVRGEIIDATRYGCILVLQSGEQLILLDDTDGYHVEAEVARMRNFLGL